MSDAKLDARQARLAVLAKAVQIWRFRQPDGSARYVVYDEISEKTYVEEAFTVEEVETMIAAGAPVEDQ